MVMTSLVNRTRRNGPNPVLKPGSGAWGWTYSRDSSSPRVDDIGALSLTAFYRGVSFIGSNVAALPLHIYEEREDGSKVKVKTPDTAYLWQRPNSEMARQSLWERIIADEVRQKGVIYVQKDRNDLPAGIWHLSRQRVKVGRTTDGMKAYQVDGEIPMIDYKQGGEIVHIPNWGDGMDGYDIVSLASRALGLGLSAEQYAHESLATGMVPPGVITTDQSLTKEQADGVVAEWKRRHAGISKSQDIAFLGNGAHFEQLSIDHEKMQMEQLRRFQVEEISRLLGLPPHLLGDVDHASQGGGNGVEEQNLTLIRFTLQAHINRIEQAIDDNLLATELTGRYCKFDLRGLMRGAMLQRYQAYAMGYGRWLTAGDIRELEDMEPVDGDEMLLAQANMVPAEQLGKVSG